MREDDDNSGSAGTADDEASLLRNAIMVSLRRLTGAGKPDHPKPPSKAKRRGKKPRPAPPVPPSVP